MQRIGILTGGGDCPGLNAVIRAAVKTAINEYGWEVFGIEDGFEGLIKPHKARLIDVVDVRGLLPQGGTMLGSTNRANPFHYEVATDSQLKVFDVSETVLHRARDYGLDVLLVIGGDGTMRIAQELMKKGLRVVGVPKTIDNDLYGTEVTVGFDTGVNTAMEALDKLHTTAESHHRVLVIELMGRHAGWIALAAGIAGGADVILIPEIPTASRSSLRRFSSATRPVRSLASWWWQRAVGRSAARPSTKRSVTWAASPDSEGSVKYYMLPKNI